MTSYAFDLIKSDGSIDTFDLACFDNDLEALRHAGLALRASPHAFAVNVWCEGVRIGRLRRDVPCHAVPAPVAA